MNKLHILLQSFNNIRPKHPIPSLIPLLIRRRLNLGMWALEWVSCECCLYFAWVLKGDRNASDGVGAKGHWAGSSRFMMLVGMAVVVKFIGKERYMNARHSWGLLCSCTLGMTPRLSGFGRRKG